MSYDNAVDLADAILVMQVLGGGAPSVPVFLEADVNNDSRLGLEDLVYILQDISGLR